MSGRAMSFYSMPISCNEFWVSCTASPMTNSVSPIRYNVMPLRQNESAALVEGYNVLFFLTHCLLKQLSMISNASPMTSNLSLMNHIISTASYNLLPIGC